ncbi:MAG: 16S rRNA (cytosine(1402)-N(4))-methyltransferase RsmH [Chlamydiales bacterium]
MRSKQPHESVLLQEWLTFLQDRHISVYVDGTLGAGGHAKAVLEKHPEIQRFIGIDQDEEALNIAREQLKSWNPFIDFVKANFSQLGEILEERKFRDIDVLFLDIGVSSMQLDQRERGFSFMEEGPLDMRMDRAYSLTAADVVNTYTEQDLGKIFREYGEEPRWRKAAAAIVQARQENPILTTKGLASVLKPVLTPLPRKRIHPLTLVFQSLRIEVNRELEVLKMVLREGIQRLSSKGIFGIITFHSLEDRIVKRAFRDAASDKENTRGLSGVFIDKTPLVKILTRKPIIATEDEVKANPRARSAKLRVIQKI